MLNPIVLYMKSDALKVFLYYYHSELLLFIGTKKCQHNGHSDSHLLLGPAQGQGQLKALATLAQA